jgi:hypothetical protein
MDSSHESLEGCLEEVGCNNIELPLSDLTGSMLCLLMRTKNTTGTGGVQGVQSRKRKIDILSSLAERI